MSIAKRIRDQRWLAATLVAFLLVAVAAPAVSRMACTMGGHVDYTVGAGFDCCPDDHPTDRPSVGATCCDITQASPLRADYVQHATPVLQDAVAAVDVSFFTSEPRSFPARPHWLDSRPPPLLVSERLAGIRTFLI
jgi:hypothetical protein